MKSSRAAFVALLIAAACMTPVRSVAQVDAATAAELEKRFAAADRNGDGKLTLDEAKAGMPRVASSFDRIDRAHRGYVTLDDIKAALGSR